MANSNLGDNIGNNILQNSVFLPKTTVPVNTSVPAELPSVPTVAISTPSLQSGYISLFGFELSKTTLYVLLIFIAIVALYYFYTRSNKKDKKKSKKKQESSEEESE